MDYNGFIFVNYSENIKNQTEYTIQMETAHPLFLHSTPPSLLQLPRWHVLVNIPRVHPPPAIQRIVKKLIGSDRPHQLKHYYTDIVTRHYIYIYICNQLVYFYNL